MTSATLPAANVKTAAGKALERYSTLARDVLSSEEEIAMEDQLRNLESLAAAAHEAAVPDVGFLDVSSEDFSLIRDFYEA